jgi:hypothetical protein
MLELPQTACTRDADPSIARLVAMATFRDGEASRRQIGTQLSALEADFARCLAMSAWAFEKPLRMLAFGLPMHTSLDECLVARLNDSGHAVGGLDDDALAPCLASRWEFVRAGEHTPPRYRPGPSFNERLRVALLIDAWESRSRQACDVDLLEATTRRLATASAALGTRLALPLALLRRAAAERQLDATAEAGLHRQLRRALLELGHDDVRYLAIDAALDRRGDVAAAVRRHGTPAMRVLLRAHVERASYASARTTLAPRIARVRRELWSPVATSS